MALSKLTVLNDKYVLRKVLGSHGPYDITYLAWNLSKERNAVVIREFNPSFIVTRTRDNKQFEPRYNAAKEHFEYGLNCFIREAAAAALIDHPNVVKHEDYFRENETSYCVSTFYPGATLEEVLEGHEGKIEKRAAFAIIMPLLDGLISGHRQGLIHGRISPGQIFLTKTGRPMFYRFHVTRLLLARRCGRVLDMNISGYTPPELLTLDGKKGPWSDVYSCGATLYAIITGNQPPDALSRAERDPFLDILHSEDEITPALKKVLYRATSLNPKERPQSVLELKQDLLDAMTATGREYQKPSLGGASKLPPAYPLGAPSSTEDFTAEDTIPQDFEIPNAPLNPAPYFSQSEKDIAGGSGDGFGYRGNNPSDDLLQSPFIGTPEQEEKKHVATNPLGPFASERLFMSPPPGNTDLQKVSSYPLPNAAMPNTPLPNAGHERIKLQKTSAGQRGPLLAGLGIAVVAAALWGAGVFKGGDATTSIDRPPLLAEASQSGMLSAADLLADSVGAPEEDEMTVTTALSASGAGIAGSNPSAAGASIYDSTTSSVISVTADSQAVGKSNIALADSFFAMRQYKAARSYYQQALAFMPDDAHADSMEGVTAVQIAEEAETLRFRRYVSQSRRLEEEKKYVEAIQQLERALNVRPDNPAVLDRIASLNAMIETDQDNDRRYQYFIGQGDGLFSAGNYEAAIARYEKALEIQADDTYATEQIRVARDSLTALTENAENQRSLYALHRNLADSLYNAGDLEGASIHYRSALTQDPEDEFVLDRIVTIQQVRQQRLGRITDTRGIFIAPSEPPELLDEASLIQQIQYPQLAERGSIEGRVILRMIVDTNGSVSELSVVRGIGFGCDAEAMRVMKNARFKPAQHEGESVTAWHTYAIMFKLLR